MPKDKDEPETKTKGILARIFRRGHPDLYQLLQQKAEEQGVKVEDLIAAGASAIVSSTDKGAQELAEMMKAKREGSGKDEDNLFKLMDKYTGFMDSITNMMIKVQEAGQKLVRGSLLNEVQGSLKLAEDIKSAGAEGGQGSFLDKVAGDVIGNILTKQLGISPETMKTTASALGKKATGAASGKISTLEEAATGGGK